MRKLLKEWAPVIGLMLVAGVLRFYELGAWPPGLYHDEAFNGLDALRVLAGDHPLYFAANHGREPFFIYLVTLSVSWLGRSVYAVRLPAAIIGLLTIPATYWMARELFGRRVGLLTAAVMTIALWPIQLSLIGLRAGALPFFIALSIAAGVHAYRSRRILAWIVAGLIYGASFYTYLASRFTPFALLAVLIVLIVTGRARRIWPGSAAFIVAAAIVLAPLALTALNQWDVVMGRPGDVSIFNPAINGGDPGGTFVHSLFNALGMFFWRGDRIPRHNVPYRPVFDPLLAVAFGLGLIRLTIGALAATPPPEKPLPDFLQPGTDFRYQVRRRMTLAPKLPSLFTLIWIGVMLLPTILAEDSPHFLRAVGVLPVALIVPAIGLDTVMQWLQSRGWRILSYIAIAVTLILSAAWTVSDYSRYAADPETGYAFEAAGVDLANQARAEILSGHRIYIADRFVRDWTSVPFLIGGAYENIADGTAPVLNPNQPATLFVWPYEDWTRLFATVAAPLRVKVTAGPQAKGDLDPQTHTGYLAVQIEPKGGADDRPEVEFENGLRLMGHSVEAIDNRHWRLRTLWQTKQATPGDQTFFVHLLSNNQQVDTRDGDSGDGFYPMRMWRPGDVIVDERIIDIPAQASWQQLLVELGVYDRNTGQRVKVVNSAQPVIDQAILLSGPAPSGPNAIGP